MKWVREILFSFLGQSIFHIGIKQVKRKMSLVYMKTLQAMRKSLIVALLVFFILQLMVLGFFGAAVTAIWLYPTPDLETKLYILLAFFGALFLIPALGLIVFFSDRMWYHLSGSQKIMQDL